MQEFAAPLVAPLSTTEGIADYVVRNAGAEPSGVAFRRRTTGVWQDVTNAMFRDEVFALMQARNNFTLPVKDPYIAESLRYVQP